MKNFLRKLAIWAFHGAFVRPTLYLVGGIQYRRRGKLPAGPCIVVANHNSHLDAAILMTIFPFRRLPDIHPVAAADYFGKTALLRTMAMLFMNGIPIERRARKGSDPLKPLHDALEQGKTLILFPEGSRGEAGVLSQFRPGIGRLVKQLPGLLVVPVFMSGPERIWPRGQWIPVPVAIHANVGKPRVYADDVEPREIAERVRKDVLALAPPPAPIPGARPAPPKRVAVCGVEPGRRHEVFRAVLERLGRQGRSVGLTQPVLEADETGLREAQGGIPVTHGLGWPRFLAWMFRTGGMFQRYRFAEMVDRARLDEALCQDRTVRHVVGDGNALVDLLAWSRADFYEGKFDEKGFLRLMVYLSGERSVPFRLWWTFIRKAPEVWLVTTFDLARPPVPDVLVVLRHPPAEILARMRAAGRPLERLHSENRIAHLQECYEAVADTLRRRGRTEVVIADANGQTPAEIAWQVAAACRPSSGDGPVAQGEEQG